MQNLGAFEFFFHFVLERPVLAGSIFTPLDTDVMRLFEFLLIRIQET
jgi:hypothetical protein